MGHCIQAIIGTRRSVQELTHDWACAEQVVLPQEYVMIFLTDTLFDRITERSNKSDRDLSPVLTYLTEAIHLFLQQYSLHGRLAYIETDYFGGVGTQAGALYENGQLQIAPCSGEKTINLLLSALGVQCEPGKDAFDSLNLGQYRHMPD